jgi:hypothetical protein
VNTVASFHEMWFDVPSQDALAGLVREVVNVDGLLVEIGSWEGRSTVAMAVAAHSRIVHAVDTWTGSPGEISERLAAHRDVFAQWQANITHCTKGNVEAHRMCWREYLPSVAEPIALAFIDAEHTYDEVYDNVIALLPLMAPGGIICGDDVHHPPVRQAVLDTLQRFDQRATLWIHRVAP